MRAVKKKPVARRFRSVLFYPASLLAFVPFLLLAPLLGMPNRFTWRAIGVGLRVQAAVLKAICGITYEVRGQENLPRGPIIIASQHQSAWETLYFHLIFDRPVMCAKEEVFRYPALGAIARKLGHISVARGGGIEDMRAMIDAATQATQAGRTVALFPSGTRETTTRLHGGASAIYQLSNVPLVPVRLNSGQFWPASSLIKSPGRIVVDILPPIMPGLDRQAAHQKLQDALLTDSH